MSAAQPMVSGKRIVLPMYRRTVVLGTFSCHWAAVAAFIRMVDPDFRSIGGDKPEDLAVEVGLKGALAAARGSSEC